MARSFVYDRPLDAKVLPEAENSNHKFLFNTLLDIKKEVDSDSVDMEVGLSSEVSAANSSELQTAHTSELQCDKSKDAPDTKLLIKLRDLWKKSEQTVDFAKKRKKSRGKDLENEMLTTLSMRSNKRWRSELSVSSKGRITRSSLLTEKFSDSNEERKSEQNCLQPEAASDKKEKQNDWSLARITCSKKKLNFICESCGMCFETNRQLRAHKRYYTADGEFHCTICDTRFNRSFQLSRHIRSAHSTLDNKNIYKYECPFCVDRFEIKTSLIAHVTHLHHDQIISKTRNINLNEELTLGPSIHKRRKKRRRSAKKSKRTKKHVATINSNNHGITSDNKSDFTANTNKSEENSYGKDEHLMTESLKEQNNEKDPSKQLIDDNPDSKNKEATTSSAERLPNTTNARLIETSILDKSLEDVARLQQKIRSPINSSREKCIKPRDIGGISNGHIPTSRPETSKVQRVTRKSQKHNEEKNKTEHRSQVGLKIMPEPVLSQLGGDIVDYLGDKAGNRCVSEPLDQPAETDSVSDRSSVTSTIDSARRSLEVKVAAMVRCTRSSTLKANILNSPATNIINSVTNSGPKATQNEEPPTQGKSTNSIEENYIVNKVCPQLDSSDERLNLLPQQQPLDQQVGSVLPSQLFEAAKRIVNTGEAYAECNNVDIDSSQVDDFEEKYESITIKFEDEEMSDTSCESISLKIAPSSSDVFLPDLLGIEAHDTTTIKSYNTPNNSKIKDIRILLVKLENMSNLSAGNIPLQSLLAENCSLVKTEEPDCNPCEKQFETQVGLGQHFRWKHNSKEVKSNKESRLKTKKKHVSNHYRSKMFSNRKRRQARRKLIQGIGILKEKRCVLCDAVFRNNFAVASHYLSVHTKAGVSQCCVCFSKFANFQKLWFHLCGNCNRLGKKNCIRFCVVCKKELSIFSLSQHCSDCSQNSEFEKCNLSGEQFSNAPYLTEDPSTHSLASGKYTSEIRSVALFETPLVSISKERTESNPPVVDHKSVKNHNQVHSRRTRDKICKTFKCSACKRVFFKSSRLKYHLLTAHYQREKCQNVVTPRILSHSTTRNCKKGCQKRCKNKNTVSKFSSGKEKKLKSKNITTHNKLCKKKLRTRRGLKFSLMYSRNSIRQYHVRGDTRPCYDHKCDVCGLNCCCRRSLIIHKARYSTGGNNVCNICGLTFARKYALVMHMETAHNRKILFNGKIRCEICNQGFYNTKFLRIHLAHFHNTKYFQCKICRIRFDTYRSLNNHTQYYSKKGSCLCDVCGQIFECKYQLEYHGVQVHNREKCKVYKYFCDVCNCAFLDELLLQAHIGHFHMQDGQIETKVIDKDVCKAMEQPPEDNQLSMKIKIDGMNSNDITINSTDRKHTDEIHCGQDLADGAIGKTTKAHTSNEYKCGICKLSFDDPCAILNHEWEFSNDGTYACNVCNRKFMTDSLLKNHKIKHYQRNAIRKYECYVCKEDFARMEHLKMHGLHLHGPEFVWEEDSEITNNHNPNTSDSQIKLDCNCTSKKLSLDNTYDTIGLIASNKIAQSGRILLFQKMSNNRSSMELLRRHSNEDTYCCNFCQTNFSSASLLEDHIKKHAYRPYYTNSLRYLCLICKNKFRTNDILRAHVIHCHTSDQEEQNHRESTCLQDSVPDKSIESHTRNNKETDSINNNAGNVAEDSLAEHAVQNQLPSSEKRNNVQQSISISSDNKKQLSNSAIDVAVTHDDHVFCTLVPHGVEGEIESGLGCIDFSDGNDQNCIGVDLVESSNPGITSHIESESMLDELESFTMKVKDIRGLEQLMCTICVETFYSVAHFKKHFGSVHVKNGAYLCTFCGEKFLLISALKYHSFRHQAQPKNYVCYNKQFHSPTDFVRHKLSHDAQTKQKQNKSITQLSPFIEVGFIAEADNESTVNETCNPCKCEICDKIFPDFTTMLKHWDICIDVNGLKCDLCRATFKSLNSLRVHKITYHEKKQNCNIVRNRPSFRVNGDQTIQITTQNGIVQNKLGGKVAIGNSANMNAFEKLEGILASTNKISKQNESLKFEKIKVKPFAKIAHNLESNDECHSNKQQINTDDISPTSNLRPELKSKHDTESSNQRDVPKTFATVSRPIKSIPQVSKPNEQVLNKIPCTANGNYSQCYSPVQGFNSISKQHVVPNDLNIRFEQNKCKEQTHPASQSHSSKIVRNSRSIRAKAYSSFNIDNTKVVSNESGPKSRLNNCKVKGPLELLPKSSNTNGSLVSSNAAGSPTYSLCIQPAFDRLDNSNNAAVVLSDSAQKCHSNDCSVRLVPSLVPSSLDPGVSPAYFQCVNSNGDHFYKSSNQTVVPVESALKSHPNDRTDKRLSQILQKRTNVVLKPIRASDIQRITHNSNTHSNRNVVSNDSRSQLHSNDSKDARVPILLATAGTSARRSLPTSLENTTKKANNPTNKSPCSRELTPVRQTVRCTYCMLLFSEKVELIKHMESHKIDNQCPACGLIFSNEGELHQHLSGHKSSTCTKCNIVSFFSDSISCPTGPQRYCSVCDTLLPPPTQKLSRSKNHFARQVRKCGICMDTFGTIYEMTVHFKLVHSSFVCGICESRFTTKASLYTHMQAHDSNSVETLQCKTCEKYFISQSGLAVHALSHQKVTAAK